MPERFDEAIGVQRLFEQNHIRFENSSAFASGRKIQGVDHDAVCSYRFVTCLTRDCVDGPMQFNRCSLSSGLMESIDVLGDHSRNQAVAFEFGECPMSGIRNGVSNCVEQSEKHFPALAGITIESGQSRVFIGTKFFP